MFSPDVPPTVGNVAVEVSGRISKRFSQVRRNTGGIGLDKFNDIKVGDVVEIFELEEVRRTLDAPYAGKPAGSAGA